MDKKEFKSDKEINQELALYIAKKCFDEYFEETKSTIKPHSPQEPQIGMYANFISEKYKVAYSKLKEFTYE